MGDRGTESYVSGLRLLTIKASPPELSAAGQTTSLSALAVDTQGRPIDVAWAYCTAQQSGFSAINNDCITTDQADFLTPFGSALETMFTLPAVDPTVFGSADQTGGLYLPLRAKVTAGTDSLTAIYNLRIGMGTPPPTANQNPVLTGIYQVLKGAGDGMDGGPSDGGSYTSGADLLTALDPATPLIVHAGDKLTLRALFSAKSAESYLAPGRPSDAGTSQPRKTTERLSLAFYATAGTIGRAMTAAADGGTTGSTDGGTTGGTGGMGGGRGSGQTDDTVLTLDSNLPASGGTIDLWVVGRDNRGGADSLHRTLTVQ